MRPFNTVFSVRTQTEQAHLHTGGLRQDVVFMAQPRHTGSKLDFTACSIPALGVRSVIIWRAYPLTYER